jgi:hypothetical protein
VTPPWRFPLENSSLVRWCGVIPVRKQGRVARTNRATIVHVRARCTNASVASRNHLGDFVGDARGNRFSAESADASFYWSKLATLARPLISLRLVVRHGADVRSTGDVSPLSEMAEERSKVFRSGCVTNFSSRVRNVQLRTRMLSLLPSSNGMAVIT